MDREALAEAVASDLFTYVLDGDFRADDFAGVIKPPDYPEQYADFERLVDLHFLLHEDVRTFVTKLDDRLRSIKTETTTQRVEQRGGIEGRIDWGATYQYRATTSPGNRAAYVADQQSEQYGIPENIVLKELISIIRQSLGDVDQYLDDDRTWVAETWAGDQRLRDTFTTLTNRNVHLQRIPDPDPHEPTDRMVARADASRKEIYREAADLYWKRTRYDRGDPSYLRSLLEATAITPQGRERLLELFVVFRTLGALEAIASPDLGQPTYHTISSSRGAVATYAGGATVKVFYNQSGAEANVSFTAFEGSPNARSEHAKATAESVADAFFTETDVQNHTKRPDVLVVGNSSRTPENGYLVIEVKDSATKATIREGISEIVEYLAFLQRAGTYEFDVGEFGSGMNGLLVVQDLDDVDFAPASIAEQARNDLPIRIAQASDVDDILPRMVDRIFSG